MVAEDVTYWVMSKTEMAYAKCLGSVQVRITEEDWSSNAD